jgi:hypothetical protein
VDKVDEYRKYAASLLELAKRAKSDDDKRRLLLMSEAWLYLADKISHLLDGAKQRSASSREAWRNGPGQSTLG